MPELHKNGHPPAPGTYKIQARAQNSAGTWGSYVDVTIVVGATPTPTTAPRVSTPTAAPSLAAATPTNLPARTPTRAATLVQGKAVFSNERVFPAPPGNFYYSATSCGSKQVNLSINVTDPNGVASVRVLYRLQEKSTKAQTTVASKDLEFFAQRGAWEVSLVAEKDIPITQTSGEYWLQYHYLATDKNGLETNSVESTDAVTLGLCK